MASLTTKGYFVVTIDDNNYVRVGVNLNGLNTGSTLNDQNDGVIMTTDGNNVVDVTNSAITTPQLNVIAANNAMYERRRVAWVKMWFYPRYSEYPAMVVVGDDGDQQLTLVENKVIYVCTDISGLETPWSTIDKPAILANNTGVKTKLMNKSFKVFRRGVKYPTFPKYQAAGADSAEFQPTEQVIGGQWLSASATALTTGKQNGHVAITAFMGSNSVFEPDTALYEVKYEIKYVWADRLALNPGE